MLVKTNRIKGRPQTDRTSMLSTRNFQCMLQNRRANMPFNGTRIDINRDDDAWHRFTQSPMVEPYSATKMSPRCIGGK
jgi:hypothetical protein